MFETAEYHFYDALARAAFCHCAAPEERQQHLEALVRLITINSKYGRSTVRKTSKTAQRWLVRRLPGLMAARSMP